jgi:hypothetical protein
MRLVIVSLHINFEPRGKKQQTQGLKDYSCIAWLKTTQKNDRGEGKEKEKEAENKNQERR